MFAKIAIQLTGLFILAGCSNGGGEIEDAKYTDLLFLDSRDPKHNPIKLRVPQLYLSGKKNWNQNGVVENRLTLRLGLPDLRPRFEGWLPQGKSSINVSPLESSNYWKNGIYLSIYPTNVAIEWNHGGRKALLRERVLQDDVNFNLEHFHSKCYLSNKNRDTSRECYDDGREYFVTPKSYSGVPALGACSRASFNANGGCTFRSEYRGKRIQYIFRNSELFRWNEFDTAARRLLDGFYGMAK